MWKGWLLVFLIAASAAFGFAEEREKFHQPSLTPQIHAWSGQLEPLVRMCSRLMAARPGKPLWCREPKTCSFAMFKV
jgi:hypothetical protein